MDDSVEMAMILSRSYSRYRLENDLKRGSKTAFCMDENKLEELAISYKIRSGN